MLFPAPLWVLGPPSPRAPTPLGAPGGTLAPINPPTLHPPLLETHVSQGVGVGPPLQPVPHPHPCQASLGFGERGCGNPQGCCFPHTPQPPAPSPALLPQQRLGNMEEAGRGGGVHECPVSSQLRAAAAPAGVMGAQWVLSCCSSCAAWGQSGDNHCWDRVRSLHGWWDEDRAPPPPVLAWTRCWQHSPAAAGKVTVSAQLPVPACS